MSHQSGKQLNPEGVGSGGWKGWGGRWGGGVGGVLGVGPVLILHLGVGLGGMHTM